MIQCVSCTWTGTCPTATSRCTLSVRRGRCSSGRWQLMWMMVRVVLYVKGQMCWSSIWTRDFWFCFNHKALTCTPVSVLNVCVPLPWQQHFFHWSPCPEATLLTWSELGVQYMVRPWYTVEFAHWSLSCKLVSSFCNSWYVHEVQTLRCSLH